jgi:predicted metalloprotease with PDZ domain
MRVRSIPLLALLLLSAAPRSSQGQSQVRYQVSFGNRVHHEADVRVHYTDLPAGPLELRMSRTSPGRYALHEFAKNVYKFQATDGAGQALPVVRPDPHQWTVEGHRGEVVITYTLFGDRADGTYAAVDESHAHLNVPATFLWARGLFDRPVELTVRVPEGSGWRVATQLAATADPYVFTAPDHPYFLDSPVEVSDFALRQWREGDQTLRVAVHHQGTEEELDRYAAAAAAIVREYVEVYGELPRFDFGTYTFLACYLPWADGDGMEHRNSTVLTSTGSLSGNMVGLLGTVAHEVFHAWNMERIRPATLEPFDFEEANMSRELWFGEGFTSYYDDIALVRAGVIDVADFGRRMGASVNGVVNSPGRRFFSPVEMSMQAPFVDAAVSVDPVNRANTFISYYTWGSVVALGLDLTLRSRFPGTSLDDLMRVMWQRHGRSERPYVVDSVEEALAVVSGDAPFARDFFDRYVRGGEVPDIESLVAAAGLILRRARPGRPYLTGAPLVADARGVRVAGGTLLGDPLYEAGLDRGDVILTVDGEPVPDRAALAEALRGRAPGQTLAVAFESRVGRRTASVTLAEDPLLEMVGLEEAGEASSSEAVRFREAWLGSR